MVSEVLQSIESECALFLDNSQINRLHRILVSHLCEDTEEFAIDDEEIISQFLSSKRIEGCSEKTILYYQSTIRNSLRMIDKPMSTINTNDIRDYLSSYQERNKVSKVTIDNTRRILSSFFSWLEDEDYISKSPVRRIKKVKTTKMVKQVYSDETLELLRDGCKELRDLAIVDLLSSTGIRVSELVGLNISDVNFHDRECIVLGKGDKERIVYFDARTKVHLQNYVNTRTDDNSALFVTLTKPHNRLKISGVEIRLRKIGSEMGMQDVYPHKFRRTLATRAIDKGMPIEQVQTLLGHQKIDTTLEYAMVNQSNVKSSHNRYIC